MEYKKFLEEKDISNVDVGFKIEEKELNPMLFDWQKKIVQWAIFKGRAAIFEDCGLGKTPQQLEWAKQINKYTNEPILILAPLAVSKQTRHEGEKFDIKVNVCEKQSDIVNGINITNYEKLHKFDTSEFSGIVLDESSILKNFAGKTRNEIINVFKNTPYKLACTATPSPNDYMELGNHSEFLEVMKRSEMLAMFFINDTSKVGTWRLKGHVKNNLFWRWLSSWAIMLSQPSDLGFDNGKFALPEIEYHEHIIQTKAKPKKGFFDSNAATLNERRQVRKETIDIRTKEAGNIINTTDSKFVVWCNLNDESSALTKYIDDAVEVAGRHTDEIKSERMLSFANGKIQRIVTKPKIAGLGMNWQICNNAVFVGLNDSWEQFYQAVRRIWRYGQSKKVNIHIIIESREGAVLANIKRKDEQAKKMVENMIFYTKNLVKQELTKSKRNAIDYNPTIKMEIPEWL